MLNIPKFKLRTTEPIKKQIAESYFESFIESKEKNDLKFYSCKGNFLLNFIDTEIDDFILIEVHCALKPFKESSGFRLHGLRPFCNFCEQNNVEILNLHNNDLIEPYEGALMSEFYNFYNSNNFRKFKHFLENPKDRKSLSKN